MAFMYDQHVKPIGKYKRTFNPSFPNLKVKTFNPTFFLVPVDSYDHWAQMKKDKEEAVAALRGDNFQRNETIIFFIMSYSCSYSQASLEHGGDSCQEFSNCPY